MKKRIGLFLVLMVIGIGAFWLLSKINHNTGQRTDEYLPAKTDGFETLQELEDASECIVRVKKEKEDPQVVKKDGTFIVSGYTMADVKILEVFYNTLGEEVQEGQVIKVSEQEFIDGGVVYHVAGYEKMKIGEEYLLFLRKSTSDDCFLTRGVIFGKVPVKEEVSVFEKNSETMIPPIVKTIAAEAREKYVK